MDFKKPRVSIWYYVVPQTGYRNDGVPLFVHGNLRMILNNQSIESLRAGGMSDDTANVVHFQPNEPIKHHGTFDLNILIDHGEDAIGVPLDFEVPHPNAYWAFDTHLGYEYRLKRAKQFDNVFLCHKAQIADFIRDGIDPQKIHYLPCAAETTCYRPFPVMKKWDWSFIGHMNSEHRIDLIDRFIKEFGLGGDKGYLGWRIGEIKGHNVLDDAAKKFSMSRMVINDSVKQDLNMRTFEAMATGSPLITEENPALLELFESGKHLLTYKTLDEAVECGRYLLKNPSLQEMIGKLGLEEILDKHTYRQRTEEILRICMNYIPQKGELITC